MRQGNVVQVVLQRVDDSREADFGSLDGVSPDGFLDVSEESER